MVTSQGRQPPAGFWSPIMGSNPNKMVEVDAGETFVLADVQGTGQIIRIWMTTMVLPGSRYNAHHYGVVRMYWDGEETPSVEAPFGAFFGVPWGEYRHYIAEPLSCTSGEAITASSPCPLSVVSALKLLTSHQKNGRGCSTK